MPSRLAERALDRFSAETRAVRPDRDHRGFNFSDSWNAVAAFAPNVSISAARFAD
jgi:hypothetical protein